MIDRPHPGQRVSLRYRLSLRGYTGLHLARSVVVVAGTGRGPINVLVVIEDDRRVVVPRGQLFDEGAFTP